MDAAWAPVARETAVGRPAAVGRVIGDENTGVTGAGGRRGALCWVGGLEKFTAGAGPCGEALVAVVAVLLNVAGAGRLLGWVVGCCGRLGCENVGMGAGLVGAGTGVTGCDLLLNVCAPTVPAGADSGVCVVGLLLNATGPGRGGRDDAGRGVLGRPPAAETGRAELDAVPAPVVVFPGC